MNYAYATAGELVDQGKRDPRFNVDPFFTALVARLEYIARPGPGDCLPATHYNQTEPGRVRQESAS